MSDLAANVATLQRAAPSVTNPTAQAQIQQVLRNAANGPSLSLTLDAQRAISTLSGDNSPGNASARGALYGIEIAARGQLRWDEKVTANLGWLFNRSTW